MHDIGQDLGGSAAANVLRLDDLSSSVRRKSRHKPATLTAEQMGVRSAICIKMEPLERSEAIEENRILPRTSFERTVTSKSSRTKMKAERNKDEQVVHRSSRSMSHSQSLAEERVSSLPTTSRDQELSVDRLTARRRPLSTIKVEKAADPALPEQACVRLVDIFQVSCVHGS